MRSVRRAILATAIVAAIVSCHSQMASAAAITPSPSTVAAGGNVRLSGDVLAPGGSPGCQVPGTVILLSDAFTGLGDSAGVAAVSLPVDATGHFDQTVTLKPTVAAGVYPITGRCGGGNRGVTASLTVQLAATGPSESIAMALRIGALMIALGLTFVLLGRRRERVRAS